MVVGRLVRKTPLFVSPHFTILWQVKELLEEVLRFRWISWNLVLRVHWDKNWIHIFTWEWAGLNLCLLYGEGKCSLYFNTKFKVGHLIFYAACEGKMCPENARHCRELWHNVHSCQTCSSKMRGSQFVSCCVATSKKNENGGHTGSVKKKIVVVPNITACPICNHSPLCLSCVLFFF